ncbi:MAG: hypothetical protein ACREQ2_14540 [Candidatus Binatia bacterium]
MPTDTVGEPIWCVLLRKGANEDREVPVGMEGEVLRAHSPGNPRLLSEPDDD